eukprot:gene1914-33327_t
MLLRTSKLTLPSGVTPPPARLAARQPICHRSVGASHNCFSIALPTYNSRFSSAIRAADVDDGSAEPPAEAPRSRGRPKKKITEDAPTILEPGAPGLPAPGEFQQTLIRSFTLGGIGLHSGELSMIRVRPAFAGEGRYFVRVPHAPPTAETEANIVTLNRLYNAAQAEGFDGTMEDYMASADAAEYLQALNEGRDPQEEWDFGGVEPIQQRQEDEEFLPASIYSVFGQQAISTWLGDASMAKMAGGGKLMSLMRMTRMKRRRLPTPFIIEIEGGCEVPILDGSALSWVLETQFAGIRIAPLVPGQEGEETEEDDESGEEKHGLKRTYMRPTEVIGVTRKEGGGFITLYPEDTIRITCGIDHSEDAEVIGSQWRSWCPLEDVHYRFEMAGARTYAVAPEQCIALRDYGFLKGGTEGTMLIAFGERWWDPAMLRYVDDEPVRHSMVDLIGDLALNATNGNAGLPIGHIVAYKADNDLVLEFVRKLHESIEPHEWVTFEEIHQGREIQMLAEDMVGAVVEAQGDDDEGEEGEEFEEGEEDEGEWDADE